MLHMFVEGSRWHHLLITNGHISVQVNAGASCWIAAIPAAAHDDFKVVHTFPPFPRDGVYMARGLMLDCSAQCSRLTPVLTLGRDTAYIVRVGSG
jgi:hypothetical protein